MPSAHTAAVEAMAAALCARRHAVTDKTPCGDCRVDARYALDFLATSEAVRAALVDALDTAVVEYSGRRKWYGDDLVSAYTDATLAALAPPEAT